MSAIKKFYRWLSDDRQTLTSKEISLLAAHQVIRLILDKNPFELPKLTRLKDEFRRYDQKKASLNQHSLWANRHTSPQAQHAFDLVNGLVVKR